MALTALQIQCNVQKVIPALTEPDSSEEVWSAERPGDVTRHVDTVAKQCQNAAPDQEPHDCCNQVYHHASTDALEGQALNSNMWLLSRGRNRAIRRLVRQVRSCMAAFEDKL